MRTRRLRIGVRPPRSDRAARELPSRPQPGARMPSDREIARRYGIDRASAREILEHLEDLRPVENDSRCAGVVLREPGLGFLAYMLGEGELDAELLRQCLDAHELLTVHALRFAVERMSEAELERAGNLLEDLMDGCESRDDYVSVMDEFAELIGVGGRSFALDAVRRTFHEIWSATVRTGSTSVPSVACLAPLAELHRALAARDATAAEAALRWLLREQNEDLVASLHARDGQS